MGLKFTVKISTNHLNVDIIYIKSRMMINHFTIYTL